MSASMKTFVISSIARLGLVFLGVMLLVRGSLVSYELFDKRNQSIFDLVIIILLFQLSWKSVFAHFVL